MKTSQKRLTIFTASLLIMGIAFSGCASIQKEKTEITGKDAVTLVEVLPEVAEYRQMLKNDGKSARVEAQDSETVWSVQVFEVVEQGDASHTATFGWWDVDKKTGEVTRSL